MNSFESADAITRASQSNFAASFKFLPIEKRNALVAIYAFCRISDDIVDNAQDEQNAKAELDAWRQSCHEAFASKSNHVVLKQFAACAQKYQIKQDLAQALIDGMEMDLTQKEYPFFDDLYEYCYRAASVVGLMCMQVFGYSDARALLYAEHLGIAFQLTNILRDIRGDLERGRIYIPQQDLKQFGLTSQDLIDTLTKPMPAETQKKFVDLMRFECRRAEKYYLLARQEIVTRDRKDWIAAEIMEAVYHSILKQIRKDYLLPLRAKVQIPKWKKVLLILKAVAKNKAITLIQ